MHVNFSFVYLDTHHSSSIRDTLVLLFGAAAAGLFEVEIDADLRHQFLLAANNVVALSLLLSHIIR